MSRGLWSMIGGTDRVLIACKWQRRVPVGSLMRCRSSRSIALRTRTDRSYSKNIERESGEHTHTWPQWNSPIANWLCTKCVTRKRYHASWYLWSLRFCYDMVIGNSSLRSCPHEAGESGFQRTGSRFSLITTYAHESEWVARSKAGQSCTIPISSQCRKLWFCHPFS